ncbi:Autophagy protein 22 [Actinomortierella ambigua]|nr:Autophagy protein 22 [Actinomortierella ambigua]
MNDSSSTNFESIDNEPEIQHTLYQTSTPAQYQVPELKRTEAWAWIPTSCNLVEMFKGTPPACGYGWTTATVLIPVLVQDLAAQAGVQGSNHALPCDPEMRHQCVAWFFGEWLEPGTIALYVSSISSIVAFFVSLSIAGIADYGMSFMAVSKPSQFWITAVLAPLGWSAYMIVTIIGTSYLCLYGRAHPQVQAMIREIENDEKQGVEEIGSAAVRPLPSPSSSAAASPSHGRAISVPGFQVPWSLETQARVHKEEEQATNDLSGWCSFWANVGSSCIIAMCIGVSVGFGRSIFSLQLATALTGVWWVLWTLACWRWLESRPGPPLPKSEFWFLISWKKNLHFTHIESMMLQLLMSVAAGIGAWVFLFIRQRWRLSTKTMIFITLVMYMLVNLYFVVPDLFTKSFGLRHGIEAWIAVGYVGLIISTYFGCLRVMMAELCPLGEENEYLSLFLLCDKGSSWIGPLVTGAIATKAGGEYRKGFWFPLGLLVVGAVLLAMVDMRKGKDEAEQFAKEKIARRMLELQTLQQQHMAANGTTRSVHDPYNKELA